MNRMLKSTSGVTLIEFVSGGAINEIGRLVSPPAADMFELHYACDSDPAVEVGVYRMRGRRHV